ncbi:MAG: flagellar hook-length control protein FliK [Candidatus Aureabacteria bacterium]|nr:flagellar hook-length control protein FliK [Candidatus Auribacterota bacterium]
MASSSTDLLIQSLYAASNSSLSDSLKNSLKSGQTVLAQILETMADGQFLLFMKGQTVLAHSNIAFSKGETIRAKVETIEPQLVLKFIESARQSPEATQDAPIKDQLSRMNILPAPDNITAAKCFARELMPLKTETFTPFLDFIQKMNLSDQKDIAIAVKMVKHDMALTQHLFEKVRPYFAETEKGSLSVPHLVETLKRIQPDLPASLSASTASVIKNLELALQNTFFSSSSSADQIFSAIKNTLDFSGFSFEKMFLAAMVKQVFEPSQFMESFPKLMEISKEILSQLSPQPVLSSPDAGFSQTVKEWLSSVTEVYQQLTVPSQAGADALVDPDLSKGLDILKMLQRSDSFLSMIKSHSVPGIFIGKNIQEELVQIIQNLMPGKPAVSSETKLLSDDQSSRMFLSSNGPLSETLVKVPVNAKEELMKLNNLFEEKGLSETNQVLTPVRKGSFEDLSIKEIPVQRVQQEIQGALDGITQKQIDSLPVSTDSPRNQEISLYWLNPEGCPNELKILFEEHSSWGQQNEKNKAFRIFFSMDLSNLGAFEINLLEQNHNMEIVFVSKEEKVMSFFKENSDSLTEALRKAGIHSVIVKTVKAGGASLAAPISSPSHILKFPNIDITV